jgi:hypothetical protein
MCRIRPGQGAPRHQMLRDAVLGAWRLQFGSNDCTSLTWISAWCGVFLGFDHFPLPHLYHLVPPLRKYHVSEYLLYRTRRYEYRTMKSDHPCVAPLLPSESSQVWAYSPDSAGVASSSGVICHLRTLNSCNVKHPEICSSCNVSTASREPACMGKAPSAAHCGAARIITATVIVSVSHILCART